MAATPMQLLAAGVPLSLLLDLAEATGPDSVSINAAERPEDDPIWLEAVRTEVARRHWAAG